MRMGEIIAQKDEFVSYFMGLLNASPHSHPNTHRVLYAASLIALFVAMHFKDKFKRATAGAALSSAAAALRNAGSCILPERACHAGPPDGAMYGLVLDNAALLPRTRFLERCRRRWQSICPRLPGASRTIAR